MTEKRRCNPAENIKKCTQLGSNHPLQLGLYKKTEKSEFSFLCLMCVNVAIETIAKQ